MVENALDPREPAGVTETAVADGDADGARAEDGASLATPSPPASAPGTAASAGTRNRRRPSFQGAVVVVGDEGVENGVAEGGVVGDGNCDGVNGRGGLTEPSASMEECDGGKRGGEGEPEEIVGGCVSSRRKRRPKKIITKHKKRCGCGSGDMENDDGVEHGDGESDTAAEATKTETTSSSANPCNGCDDGEEFSEEISQTPFRETSPAGFSALVKVPVVEVDGEARRRSLGGLGGKLRKKQGSDKTMINNHGSVFDSNSSSGHATAESTVAATAGSATSSCSVSEGGVGSGSGVDIGNGSNTNSNGNAAMGFARQMAASLSVRKRSDNRLLVSTSSTTVGTTATARDESSVSPPPTNKQHHDRQSSVFESGGKAPLSFSSAPTAGFSTLSPLGSELSNFSCSDRSDDGKGGGHNSDDDEEYGPDADAASPGTIKQLESVKAQLTDLLRALAVSFGQVGYCQGVQ